MIMNKLNKILFTRLYLSTLFVCSFLLLQAQVWTGNVDTDWDNPANWNNNQVPTSGSIVTVPGSATNGNFPVFEGGPIIDYTIQNAGVITFNSFVFNTGTIINFNVGQLVSNNFFVNAGKVVFDNDGHFDNNGVFENYGEFDNAASAIFNNYSIYNNYGIFRNFGNFNNSGSFNNTGTFSSTQTFTNDGSMSNFGTFDNVFASTFNNNSGASIVNNNGAIFTSNGTFENTSTLQNEGEVIINFGGTLHNRGDINNNQQFTNSGKIYNNSPFQNNGILRNNDAAFFENNDVLQNNGTIDHGICAKFIQQANNTIGGIFENNGGLIYVLAGAVNVTGGEFGYEFTDLNQTAPPVPGCKANVQVSLDEAGVAVVQVDDIDRGAYGNCGAQITDRTVTPNTFGVADIGQQVVTLSVTDEFNLTATCDAVIQILEYVAPLAATDDPDIDMSCPNDITLTTLPGANTAVASWTEPTGTSNCSSTPPPSDCNSVPTSFPNTIYMGEYNGSKYFCSQYNLTYLQGRQLANQMGGHLVVINDAAENEYIRSHIMASSAWIGYTDEASEGNYVWEANQSSDYVNWDAGQPNNYGGDEDYTRILQSNGKWTDRNGNVYLEAVIEIPCGGMNCTNVTLNLTFDNYSDETSWDIQDANGTNVAWGGYYGNHPNGGSTQENICLPDGCYTFTIYDSYGDGICCTEGNGSYTLVDTNGDVLVSGGQFGTFETTSFCIENNGGGGNDELVIEQIAGLSNGAAFFAGTTQVAYKGTDDCGNEEICLFEVTVNKTPSTITSNCPTDIVIDALPGAESAIATWTTPTATSDCFSDSGVSVARIGEGLASGDAFPIGTTFIAYALQDSCGNTATCNFSVTINETPAALSLLSCPEDLTGSNPISWTAPTASTTCFTGNVLVRQVEGPENGSSTFPQGTSQISYLLSDDCGNVEVCTFIVTNDGAAPPTDVTIACREDLIINLPAGSGGTTVTLETATASTTCEDGVVNVAQTSGPTSGTFFPVGTHIITYEATDNCGNTATCSYQVVITEEPQGTGDLTIYCPGDQIGRAPVGGTSTVVEWTAPTASTTCSTSPNVVVTQTDGLPSGSEFPVGTSMVTFQATDDCGNVETCTFKIMVTNDECNIEATASNVLCDDNGTPDDPSDDTFTFDLIVTGVGNPWGWTGGGQTVEYDQVTEFGPYNISEGIVGFTVTDTDNPTCSANISVDAPEPCSDDGPNTICNNDLLFVVGNTNLNNGDIAAKNRMESLNFNVTVIDDNVVQTADGLNRGLIVISSTTNSGAVNTKFRDIDVPVVTWEAWLYDDMKMTEAGTNVGYGKYQYDSRAVMNDIMHPIAAGLTELVQVFNSDKSLNWGRPSEGANIIACLPGDETKVLVFAYEEGKQMVGLTAPARRVGFFLRNSTPQHLTDAGWAMFDAAIIWAAGCTPSTQGLAQYTPDIIESVEEKELPTRTTTELTLELDTPTTTADFSVFPNPASDYTQMDLKAFIGQEVDVFIYNQSGQLVKQQPFGELNQAVINLDVSTLQNGMHLIRVVADGQMVTKKLLITRTF